MLYIIESAGRCDCRGAKVIDATGDVATFATRKEARAHRDSILCDQPSKYLPLVVRPTDEYDPPAAETVRLFEPAPTVMPGQLGMGCGCPDDCNCRRPYRTNYCGCSAHGPAA